MTSPAWARALLRGVVPGDQVEDLLGDLEEVHLRRLARHPWIIAWLLSSWDAVEVAVGSTVDRTREALSGGWVSPAELRLSVRSMRRHPLVTATSVLALAVGIALATTGFTLVTAILDPELPFQGGERFVDVRLLDSSHRTQRGPGNGVFPILKGVPGLDHLGAVRGEMANLRHGDGTVELVSAARLTPGTFQYLPFQPLTGRPLQSQDALPGASPVVVLQESLWKRSAGADPAIVGRSLEIGGVSHVVVGVLPDGVVYPARAEIWLPLPEASLADPLGAEDLELSLFGVLSDGVEPPSVEAGLQRIAAAWISGRGDVAPFEARVRRVGETDGAALPGAVFIVVFVGLLVVVAGNVANLIVARTAARRGELAVRTALGASRSRLVAQLSTEVLIMAILASAMGLAASAFALAWFSGGMGEGDELPVWMDLGMEPRVVGFVLALTLLVTLLSGVLPALKGTRRDPGQLLRGASGASAPRTFGRFHDAMVVLQISTSIGILGAALMLHAGWMGSTFTGRADLPAEELLLARVSGGSAADQGAGTLPVEAIEATLRALPGVREVGLSTHTPGSDAPQRIFEVEESPGASDPTTTQRLSTASVRPGFLPSLDATVLAGRLFVEEDFAPDAPRVVVVNQPFVDRVLAGGNPLGRRIRLASGGDGADAWREIVGVVPDLGLSAADAERAAGVYLPLEEASTLRLLVRTQGAPLTLAGPVQRALYDLDPTLVTSDSRVLAGELELLRRVYRLLGNAFATLGVIVLLLSTMALYAILSFEVTRRTREIGIRVALGAGRGRVLRSLLGRVAVGVALAGALGTAVGMALLSVIRATVVMQFPATGPLTFVALVAGAAITGLLASTVPALRALRIRPMEALQTD